MHYGGKLVGDKRILIADSKSDYLPRAGLQEGLPRSAQVGQFSGILVKHSGGQPGQSVVQVRGTGCWPIFTVPKGGNFILKTETLTNRVR